MKTWKFNVRFVIIILFVFNACTPDNPVIQSSEKKVLSFVFLKADNPGLSSDVGGVILTDTIKVAFPHGTSLINLKPAISFSGKTIYPPAGVAQNFSGPVTYTLTAANGSTANYIISARVLSDSAKTITSFLFRTSDNPGLSGNVTGIIRNDSVLLTVPFATNVTNLRPYITITGTNISPASLSPNNFSNPVTYLVTADDGTTRSYTAAVFTELLQGTLYINSAKATPITAGYLYAIDPNTGSLKWKLATSSGTISSMAFLNGVLFTGLQNTISAIDTSTRNIKWQYTTGGPVASTPVVVNGVVYANSGDRYLYAIDAANGTLKWRYAQTQVPPGSSVPPNHSSPTVANGVVYVGSTDGYIYAIDEATGVLKWKTYDSYPGGIEISSNPGVVNNTVYVTDSYRNLLALNAANGNVQWVFSANAIIYSSPTIVGGIVYFTSDDNYIYAVNAVSGTLVWKYNTNQTIEGSAIVSDGVVFAAASGNNISYIHAVDAITGVMKWNRSNPDRFESSPLVFNKTVYIGAYSSLLAYDAVTGSLKWKFTATTNFETLMSSPTIIDKAGTIYYPAVSGAKD